MWRDKQKSGSILGGVTVIWLLFEGIGYHLLTFLCHLLIVFLTVSFVWSNAASFINRSRLLRCFFCSASSSSTPLFCVLCFSIEDRSFPVVKDNYPLLPLY